MPEQLSVVSFRTEDEAKKVAARYPTGSEMSDTLGPLLVESPLRRYIEEIIDRSNPSMLGAGDAGSSLAWETLKNAGISNERGLAVSHSVLDFLGKKRVDALKKRFGENWEAVAEFEYCWLNLPHSPPAYVAAAYNYHYFITEDDFSAGYLLRDLEYLVHGVESGGAKLIEMQTKAGERGGESSKQAKRRRMVALMDAIAEAAQQYPDVVRLRPKVLARLAADKCREADPALWKQGEGKIDEYLDEIRWGDAGEELKARYEAVFPQKSPRRLRR